MVDPDHRVLRLAVGKSPLKAQKYLLKKLVCVIRVAFEVYLLGVFARQVLVEGHGVNVPGAVLAIQRLHRAQSHLERR